MSRRSAIGDWGTPLLITAPLGAGLRATALSDSGQGIGPRTSVPAAVSSPAAGVTQERVYVTPTRRCLRTLARARHLELVATAVTTKPGGAVGRSSEQAFLTARKRT